MSSDFIILASPAPVGRFTGVSPAPEYVMLPTDTLHRASLEHDLQVKEIAAAFQFTPNEVAAYYVRVGRNAGRTRRRFEKARKLLDGMSDVE